MGRAYTRLAALIADGLVGTVTHVTAMGVGDLINHGACDCGHLLTPQAQGVYCHLL